MIQFLKNLFKWKHRWICEYCGDVVRCHKRPLCKPCCHIHQGDVKMIKIDKE